MTSTLTTVFSAFSSFGLIAVSAWFISEYIVFNRYKGRKWLAEVLDVSKNMEKATSYNRWMKKTALTWGAQIVRHATVAFRRMNVMFGRRSGVDSVESIPPLYAGPIILPSTRIMAPRTGPVSPTQPVVRFQLGRKDERNSDEASWRQSDAPPVASLITPPSSSEPGAEVSVTRARFMNLVRSAIMVNRLIGIGDEAKARVSGSLTDGQAADRKSVAVIMPRSSRIAGLVPRLQNMAPTQDIPAHTALVRHMQVSVN